MELLIKKNVYFKEEWLSDPLFEKWLVKGTDKQSATCRTCQVQLNLSNMCWRALTSRMEGKKHVQKSKPVSGIFKLSVFIKKPSGSGSQPIRQNSCRNLFYFACSKEKFLFEIM